MWILGKSLPILIYTGMENATTRIYPRENMQNTLGPTPMRAFHVLSVVDFFILPIEILALNYS